MSRAKISNIPREKKFGLETFFRLILSEKKNDPLQTIEQFFQIGEKMLLLNGKIGKAYKVLNLFLFTRSTKVPPFCQTWILACG